MICTDITSVYENRLKQNRQIDSIIHDMDVMVALAKNVTHITELGVRKCFSAYAWLMGRPKKFVGVDIVRDIEWVELEELAEESGIRIEFIHNNDLFVYLEPTDLLFIDSKHTYEHVLCLLRIHEKIVGKYIVLHDAYDADGSIGQSETQQQVHRAILDFLEHNPQWEKVIFKRPCGLVILERGLPS